MLSLKCLGNFADQIIFCSFGNFVNRALKFVSSQYSGTIPDGGDASGPISPNDIEDAEFISDINNLIKDYIDAMDSVRIRLGIHTVMLISNRGNLYLQSSGLGKALMTENPARCARVISRAINLIYVLSALVYPFMPATSESMLIQLNAPARVVPPVLSTDILAGHQIGTPEHLFKKIEESMADVWRAKFGGIEGNDTTAAAEPVSKRKADAARKAAAKAELATKDMGPKSPEALALEAKISEQGLAVRALKGQTPRTPEVEELIAAAVEELKRLKNELASLEK